MRVEADTARVRGDGGGRDAPAWASWSAALLALAIVLLVAATGGLAGAAASMRLQHGAEHTCAAARTERGQSVHTCAAAGGGGAAEMLSGREAHGGVVPRGGVAAREPGGGVEPGEGGEEP